MPIDLACRRGAKLRRPFCMIVTCLYCLLSSTPLRNRFELFANDLVRGRTEQGGQNCYGTRSPARNVPPVAASWCRSLGGDSVCLFHYRGCEDIHCSCT